MTYSAFNLGEFLYQQLGWYGLFFLLGVICGLFLMWRRKRCTCEKAKRYPKTGADGVCEKYDRDGEIPNSDGRR